MLNKKNAALCILIIFIILYCSCAASQPPVPPVGEFPGFWLGLWQGFISPITFIISLFPNTVRIYAYPNAGVWYDFGFMLGIGGFSGGIFGGAGYASRP